MLEKSIRIILYGGQKGETYFGGLIGAFSLFIWAYLRLYFVLNIVISVGKLFYLSRNYASMNHI